ncbi:hypothetical protein DID78_01830 [Candidatus Marinamargulisbacteria bacterium SCGC AG-343-D04]|nr:hypothetical protein DID78_01830 [Candidatus Marinamargulisbacteria bacterium SCGC AG-343-D04]
MSQMTSYVNKMKIVDSVNQKKYEDLHWTYLRQIEGCLCKSVDITEELNQQPPNDEKLVELIEQEMKDIFHGSFYYNLNLDVKKAASKARAFVSYVDHSGVSHLSPFYGFILDSFPDHRSYLESLLSKNQVEFNEEIDKLTDNPVEDNPKLSYLALGHIENSL